MAKARKLIVEVTTETCAEGEAYCFSFNEGEVDPVKLTESIQTLYGPEGVTCILMYLE